MGRFLVALGILVLFGCGEDTTSVCAEGEARPCPCADDADVGLAICDGAGNPGECACAPGCVSPGECPDPGSPCTYNLCIGGRCQVGSLTGSCDDGDPCTEGEVCADDLCVGEPVVCDDGDGCTVDSCGTNGCTFTGIEGCCATVADCGFQMLCVEGTCEADPEPCGDAAGSFAEGLVEIAHDDTQQSADVSLQDWTITDAQIPIGDTALHEAVRFELEHPAKVHGFRVLWAVVPERDDGHLVAGLYGDFGYNGFDFWQAQPLWQGSRCAQDSREVAWVDYVLPDPLDVPEPGLIYVAHRREGIADPAFLFDVSTANEDGSCGGWDDCRSSLNFPELKQGATGGEGFFAWNGLSMQLKYDFRVRLLVKYQDQIPEDERWFQRYQAPLTDDGEPGAAPGGGRLAFGDYDGDGDDDLLVPGPGLWRNDNGVFTDVTGESGISGAGITSSGGIWGDWDNDGCLDVFFFQDNKTTEEVLMRSGCDGTFEDVTFESGIYDIQLYNPCGNPDANYRSPTPAAAWVDIDTDGFLDLYLSNLLCWDDYSYYADTVWHNEGDGTFQQWTGTHGFPNETDPMYAGRGVSAIDADQDGDIDIFVNNYVLHPNLYFQNQGDGTVVESAEDVGLAGHGVFQGGSPAYGHSIGAAWGDLDNDADFDLVVANLAHPRFYSFSDKSQVLMQQDDGTFVDIQGDFAVPMGEAGLRYSETHSVPLLADFDLDGHLDLVITATYSGRPTDYYTGLGDGTFELRSYAAGIDLRGGWGVAWADVDLDGDPDLMASNGLYLNERPDGEKGHWLQLQPVGNVTSNRAAIGATVHVTAGGVTRIRHINGGTGQGCQNALVAHFGLGDATEVTGITVAYPAGDTVTYDGPFAIDQRLVVYEDGGVGEPLTPDSDGGDGDEDGDTGSGEPAGDPPDEGGSD